jgi:hypothetical protein
MIIVVGIASRAGTTYARCVAGFRNRVLIRWLSDATGSRLRAILRHSCDWLLTMC